MQSKNVLNILAELAKWPDCYVVGGGVRDLLLGRKPSDFDLVLPKPEQALSIIKSKTNCTSFILGEKNGQYCYRLMAGDNNASTLNRLWFDLVELRSGQILRDLGARDFTVNAMALPLEALIRLFTTEATIYELVDQLIDPYHGFNDIDKKILREVSPTIFQDDPLRLWRLWRFAAELGFSPTDKLIQLASEHIELCTTIPGERIRTELFGLLQQSESARYLAAAAGIKLLERQFPAMVNLKNCVQNEYHYQDVWDHSFQTLIEMEYILCNLNDFFFEEGHIASVNKWLVTRNNLPILKLAALFHDLGKPCAKQTTPDGRIHFYGHEKAGLPLINVLSKRMRLSIVDKRLLSFLVERHLQIHSIIKAAAVRTQVRFWRRFGENTIGLTLLGCADLRAKKDLKDPINTTNQHFAQLIPGFFDLWLNKVNNSVNIKPLLNGSDIMQYFDLPSGKLVGLIKEAVFEAQLEGTINSKDDAFKYAASIIASIT